MFRSVWVPGGFPLVTQWPSLQETIEKAQDVLAEERSSDGKNTGIPNVERKDVPAVSNWGCIKRSQTNLLAGGLKHFFIFIPVWGRFPTWLIFFKGVEKTSWICFQDVISVKVATILDCWTRVEFLYISNWMNWQFHREIDIPKTGPTCESGGSQRCTYPTYPTAVSFPWGLPGWNIPIHN